MITGQVLRAGLLNAGGVVACVLALVPSAPRLSVALARIEGTTAWSPAAREERLPASGPSERFGAWLHRRLPFSATPGQRRRLLLQNKPLAEFYADKAVMAAVGAVIPAVRALDRKSTRLNSTTLLRSRGQHSVVTGGEGGAAAGVRSVGAVRGLARPPVAVLGDTGSTPPAAAAEQTPGGVLRRQGGDGRRRRGDPRGRCLPGRHADPADTGGARRRRARRPGAGVLRAGPAAAPHHRAVAVVRGRGAAGLHRPGHPGAAGQRVGDAGAAQRRPGQ